MIRHEDTPSLDTSFHDHEMAIDTAGDRAWYRWLAEAERLMSGARDAAGEPGLDGDEAVDGYSLDSAYDAFCCRVSPSRYAGGKRVSDEEARRARNPRFG